MTSEKQGLHQLCKTWTRRPVLTGLAAVAASATIGRAWAAKPVSFGLTPVFLDSDIRLLANLQEFLSAQVGRPVELVKRRTYQEITLMLLSGQLDAAWICGFPFIQYRDQLSVIGVPLYNGDPLYQSYLIANQASSGDGLSDFRGHIHAFSDPDSNSGYLVTRALLADMEERPETFFSRTVFTYGHRNVIRAVASGLAASGSVDGYVWDVMKETEPHLIERTRVVRKSEWLGFPPVACLRANRTTETVAALTQALLTMTNDPLGKQVLSTLHLDGFVAGDDGMFGGIATLYDKVKAQA